MKKLTCFQAIDNVTQKPILKYFWQMLHNKPGWKLNYWTVDKNVASKSDEIQKFLLQFIIILNVDLFSED